MSGTPILETITELEITAISAPLLNTDRVFITRGTVTYTGTMAQLVTYLAESGQDIVGTGATAFPRYDTSQSLSAAQKAQLTTNIGVFDPTINNQTGTAYTLQTVATDNDGKTIVRANNASANTVTVIAAQTRPFVVRQVGAGITTLVAGAGVTLNGNLTFSGANDSKSIVPIGGGVFDVYGGA